MRGVAIWSRGVLTTALILAGGAVKAEDNTPAYILPEVIISTEAGKTAPKSTAKKQQGPAGHPGPATSEGVSAGESSENTAAGISNETMPVSGTTGSSLGAYQGVSSNGVASDRIVEQVTTVEQVTAEQIEQANAKTLDEAIHLMNGLYVRNGGDGVPRIDVRGFRTRNVILLLDGVPLNATFDGQFDPRAIPVENIASIKVTRGGSSVLYGPGGNAAVIDIITKSAAPGLHTTSDAGVGFGKEKDASATASYGSHTIKTFVGASVYQQDAFHLSDDFDFTPRQPSDRRVNSDREDRSFYANTEWTPSDAFKWGASVNYRNGEYGKPPSTIGTDKTVFGPLADFAAGANRFERLDGYDSISLQTSGQIKLSPVFSIRPTAYFNQLSELTNNYDDETFSTQNKKGASNEDATTQIGGGLQAAYRFSGNLLTLSLNAENQSWESQGFQVNQHCSVPLVGGTCPNPKKNQIVAQEPFLAQHDIQILSAAAEQELPLTSQLSSVLGIGWANQDQEDSADGNYTYLVGGRYQLTNTTALRGSVARKIRFPTLRNLFDITSGNPDLQPEVTQNYEVAVEQQFLPIKAFLSVDLFRIDAANFIEMDNATQLFRNDEALRFQGVENTLVYNGIPNLGLQVGYTFLDSTNLAPPVIGGTSAVQNEPEHKVTLSASYRFDWGTTLRADYLYAAGSVAISKDNINTLPLAPYHLLDFGITQDISGGAFQLFARVENLFDENYETSFGFPEPGRTFFAGFRTKL